MPARLGCRWPDGPTAAACRPPSFWSLGRPGESSAVRHQPITSARGSSPSMDQGADRGGERDEGGEPWLPHGQGEGSGGVPVVRAPALDGSRHGHPAVPLVEPGGEAAVQPAPHQQVAPDDREVVLATHDADQRVEVPTRDADPVGRDAEPADHPHQVCPPRRFPGPAPRRAAPTHPPAWPRPPAQAVDHLLGRQQPDPGDGADGHLSLGRPRLELEAQGPAPRLREPGRVQRVERAAYAVHVLGQEGGLEIPDHAANLGHRVERPRHQRAAARHWAGVQPSQRWSRRIRSRAHGSAWSAAKTLTSSQGRSYGTAPTRSSCRPGLVEVEAHQEAAVPTHRDERGDDVDGPARAHVEVDLTGHGLGVGARRTRTSPSPPAGRRTSSRSRCRTGTRPARGRPAPRRWAPGRCC